MKRYILTLLLISFLLAIAILGTLVENGKARGGVYFARPQQDAVETIDLGTAVSVSGSLFVHNGTVDFYVKSPTNSVILLINSTQNTEFKFSKGGDGNYSLHISNPSKDSNVSVTLDYGLKFLVELSLSVVFSASVGMAHVLPPTLVIPEADDTLDSLLEEGVKRGRRIIVWFCADKILCDLVSFLRNNVPLLSLGLFLGLIVKFPRHCRKARAPDLTERCVQAV